VLQLNGAFNKNPARGRARANEPQVSGELGNAPSFLSKDEKAVWRQIRRTCTWLSSADQLPVEAICKLVWRIRSGAAKSSDFGVLNSLMASVGIPAAHRSKVQMPTKEEKDPFAAFMEDLTADNDAEVI